ncbi:MAG: J domain-containing protein [Pseudomonadales bacterium]|nr:J domain-containing protein [Pseudomonadales bacterium]
MSYFVGVASVNQLKIEYRRLAAKYHPDRGGDSRQMQEINAYYEHIRTKLKAKERADKNNVKAPKTSKRTEISGYEQKTSRQPSHQKTDSASLDFQNVSVGETVFVNGTEGEVTEVSDLSFRVVAKGRARQAIFNKIGGKGKYNQRLNASYDNRHKKRGFSAVV